MSKQVQLPGGLVPAACLLLAATLLFSLTPLTLPASAQTLTVIHTFTGGTDGALATNGLTQDSVGNFYGTTGYGGDPNCNPDFTPPGCGTVFKIDTTEKETILHSFAGPDGSNPSSLLELAGGAIYGTTSSGGANSDGTVFEMSANGGETALYSFTSSSTDVYFPTAGVVRDPNGVLFGTGYYGGASNDGGIFKLKFSGSSGKDLLLHSFAGGTNDGGHPNSQLVVLPQGVYGTTVYGGTGKCNNGFALGCGVVYTLKSDGESVLHNFAGTDGAYPGLLLPLGNGSFYGITGSGGASQDGTVYEMDASGAVTTLYSFAGGADGVSPGGLVQDSSGNLFGNTYIGGISNAGSIYELSPDGQGGWTEKVLYTFTGGTDGSGPQAGLVLDEQTHTIYGVTIEGGDSTCYAPYGCGTVFALSY